MLRSLAMETTIYIHGQRGRMGQAVAAVIEKDRDMHLQTTLEIADIAIDFSAPSALHALLERCESHRKPIVIGTTGYSTENEEQLREASKTIPILYSPNFSLGMAATIEAAKLLADRLQGAATIEIVEAHHIHKKDQPSGSALAIKNATGASHIHSIRAGDIIGDHTVLFILGGERIELRHQVFSREAFARGAIAAARFLKTKPPGLYTIKDLL